MGTKDSGEHKKFVFNFKRFSLKKNSWVKPLGFHIFLSPGLHHHHISYSMPLLKTAPIPTTGLRPLVPIISLGLNIFHSDISRGQQPLILPQPFSLTKHLETLDSF